MQYLANLLPNLLRRAGDSDDAREQGAFAAWLAVCGSHLRQATAPIRLERKTLWVATTDSTWCAQLKGMSGQLLFKLNSLLGSPLVTSIEFVVNEPAVRARIPAPEPSFVFTEDTRVLAQDLETRVEPIADTAVRDTFLRAAGKCLHRWQPETK
jgi:hypothetical protein